MIPKNKQKSFKNPSSWIVSINALVTIFFLDLFIVRLLDLVKPFLPILPEVNTPLRKVSYEDKLLWTVGAGIIYYVMSEIPYVLFWDSW